MRPFPVRTDFLCHLIVYSWGSMRLDLKGSVAVLAYVPGFNNGRLVKVSWGPNPSQNSDTLAYDAEGRLKKQTRMVNDQMFIYEVTSFVSGSLARYDPFGNYRTWPSSAVNPAISNHGFTGHRHNNTGIYPTQNVGLIYMNARYYLPEVGRFISPDTIVPEPGNPQSYNR
jgi:RHS repeat-associated protein